MKEEGGGGGCSFLLFHSSGSHDHSQRSLSLSLCCFRRGSQKLLSWAPRSASPSPPLPLSVSITTSSSFKCLSLSSLSLCLSQTPSLFYLHPVLSVYSSFFSLTLFLSPSMPPSPSPSLPLVLRADTLPVLPLSCESVIYPLAGQTLPLLLVELGDFHLTSKPPQPDSSIWQHSRAALMKWDEIYMHRNPPYSV